MRDEIARLADGLDSCDGDLLSLEDVLWDVPRVFRATSVWLACYDRIHCSFRYWLSSGAGGNQLGPEARAFYEHGYMKWHENPWAATVTQLGPGNLMYPERAGTRQVLKTSRFYRDFIQRFDILETLGYSLLDSEGMQICFGIFRPERHGAFDNRDRSRLLALWTPLVRVVTLSRLTEQVTAQAAHASLLVRLKGHGIHLTPRQAQACWLRYHGLSEKEIAVHMQIQPRTVKELLSQARQAVFVRTTNEMVRLVSQVLHRRTSLKQTC